MAVHVLTDSTADLPERIATQHGITVVPLNLHFNDSIKGRRRYMGGGVLSPDG